MMSKAGWAKFRDGLRLLGMTGVLAFSAGNHPVALAQDPPESDGSEGAESKLTEIEVQGLHDGQTAYVVRIPQEGEKPQGTGRKSSAALGLGIFSPKGAGSRKGMQPVVYGRVLGAWEHNNGILAQLQMGRSSERNESIAVLDGRVTLFHAFSRPDQPKSWLRFGRAGSKEVEGVMEVPVFDPVTGAAVQLGTIKSLDHISVASVNFEDPLPNNRRAEFVVVSVRHTNMFGNGITFGFVVGENLARRKPGKRSASGGDSSGASPNDIELMGKAYVLDYRFYGKAELDGFDSPYANDSESVSMQVICPVLMRALANRDHLVDHPLLGEWREKVRYFSEHFGEVDDPIVLDMLDAKTFPLLDVISGKWAVLQKPHQYVATEPWEVVQQIDPLHGRSGFFIEESQADFSGDVPRFLGTIGRNNAGDYLFTYITAPTSPPVGPVEAGEEHAAVAVVDRSIQLVVRHSKTDETVVVPALEIREGDQIERLTGVYHRNSKGWHYVVFSLQFAEAAPSAGNVKSAGAAPPPPRGATYVSVLQEVGSGLQLFNQYPLSMDFQSAALLNLRTKVFGEADGHSRLVYDHVTQATNEVDYQKLAKPTFPHVDLLKSRSSKIQRQVYLQPIEQVELGNHLYFVRYDPTGASELLTGMYRFDYGPEGSEHEEYFSAGELLFRGKKPGPLEQKVLEHFPKRSALEPLNGTMIRLFAVGADQQASRSTQKAGAAGSEPPKEPEEKEVTPRAFKVLVVVEPTGHRKYPLIKEIEMPRPFEQLKAAWILPGKRASANEVSLLFFFKPTEEGGEGGVWTYGLRLGVPSPQSHQDQRVSLERTGNDHSGWLTHDVVDTASMQYRVLVDQQGALVWSDTPDKAVDDRGFAVRKLMVPGKRHFPNTAGAEVAAISADEAFADTMDYEITYSRWQILSAYALEARIKGLTKILADRKQYDATSEAQKSRLKEAFFELGGYLDEWLRRMQTPQGDRPAEPRQRILLVDAELKSTLMTALYVHLCTNDRGPWSLISDAGRTGVLMNLFDPGTTEGDLLEELRTIAASRGSSGRIPMLVGDFRAAYEATAPLAAHESGSGVAEGAATSLPPPPKAKFEPDELVQSSNIPRRPNHKPSVFFLVSTEGTAAHHRAFQQAQGFSPKIAKLWIASPRDLAEARLTYPEERSVVDQYTLDARFLTQPWTVWGPDSEKRRPEIAKFVTTPDEVSIFSDLRVRLEKAADANEKPRHQVLLVPEPLKPFARKILLGLYNANHTEIRGSWSHHNDGLSLLYYQGPTSGTGEKQDAVLDNLAQARLMAQTGRRPVVIAELDQLRRAGAPAPADDGRRGYRLRDPADVPPGEDGLAPSPKGPIADTDRAPHMLWLLATEGRRLTADQLRKGVQNAVDPSVPMVLIGSPSEWRQLTQQDTLFEGRFGLVESFEVAALEAPSEDRRLQLLQRLMDAPEIRSLNYQFKMGDKTPDTSRVELLATLVARVNDIANQMKRDPVEAFVHTYGAFRRHLIEDATLRSRVDERGHRYLERQDLERLLMRVFPIPINPAVLPPEDPLLKMKDPDRAALGLQAAGYDGPIEFKALVARLMWNQTRPSDEGRPIPSSMILFGGTGTGKTHLARTLAKFMGLKLYAFERPGDEEANAIIVKVQSISDSPENANPESIAIDTLIEHLYNLLAMPQGHRAFLWFDDLHKAPTPNILRKLLAFIQTLLEAKDGLVQARRMGANQGNYVSVPTRNVFLGISLNPTQDEERAERYVGRDKTNIYRHILAALDREGVRVEESLLARFGSVIDMSRFPREAKAPALIRRLRDQARTQYSMVNRLVIVDPSILVRLVSEFPDAHAREFLTGAQSELLQIPPDLPPAPLYIVGASARAPGAERGFHLGGSIKVAGVAVDQYVRRNRVVRPVLPDELEGRLDFIHFLANGFRIGTLEAIVLGAQVSANLSGSQERRKNYYAPLALSVVGDLADHPEIPFEELVSTGMNIGMSRIDPDVFADAISRRSRSRLIGGERMPFTLPTDPGQNAVNATLRSFRTFGSPTARDRTIFTVFDEMTVSVTEVLRGAMARYFRVDRLDALPDPRAWIERLDPQGKAPDTRDLRQSLVDQYIKFVEGVTSVTPPKQLQGFSAYELGRLYLMVVNRALTRLPWAEISDFSLRALIAATNDSRLGMRDGLLHFLFGEIATPLHSMTPDFVLDLVTGSDTIQAIADDERKLLNQRFRSQCEVLFEETKRGSS